MVIKNKDCDIKEKPSHKYGWFEVCRLVSVVITLLSIHASDH
jgi:hypothetical protein